MLYALKRSDGGVSIMGTVPIAVDLDERTFVVERVLSDRLVVAASDEGGELSFSIPITCPASDLKPDSLDDATLVFPDPHHEVAKFAPAQRDAIVDIQPIERADIPADRTYRNAWRCDGRTIQHDMAKARDLHRDRMRTVRASLLATLDVDYQRADERGDAEGKKAIAARKQELRDVTQRPEIDAAEDIVALAAAWPECLGSQPV